MLDPPLSELLLSSEIVSAVSVYAKSQTSNYIQLCHDTT